VKRIVCDTFSRDVIARDGVCVYGLIAQDGCSGGLHAHHIKKRSQGGGDVLENGICLCAKHHDAVHRGDVSYEQLINAIRRFYPNVGE